jgi:hypothetical protein
MAGRKKCELTSMANRGLLTARLAMQHIICAQGEDRLLTYMESQNKSKTVSAVDLKLNIY